MAKKSPTLAERAPKGVYMVSPDGHRKCVSTRHSGVTPDGTPSVVQERLDTGWKLEGATKAHKPEHKPEHK